MPEDVYFINANLGFIVGGYDGMYFSYGEILERQMEVIIGIGA